MPTVELPKPCLEVIDNYFNLKAAEGKYVRCPYFRNPKSGKERWGLTAYSGKGSPKEIEEELRIVEKLEYKDFNILGEEEIRDIMKKRKLGIECSGFIARVLDAWTKEQYKKPIYSVIRFHRGFVTWLFSKLRPYTHIDIQTLVNEVNSREISNIGEIMPGDLIRFNTNIDHAVIVTRVEVSDQGKVEKVHYAQSVLEDNDAKEGVKRGIVEFIRPQTNNLLEQKWSEEPETGYTINERGVPKIYRLKFRGVGFEKNQSRS